MGLGDLLEKTASVLMTFKADTSDLKEKMRELKGEQKDLAAKALESADTWNDALEGVGKGLENAKKQFEFLAKAIEFGGKAWQAYEKAANQASGAEVKRAQEALKSIDVDRARVRSLEDIKIAEEKREIQRARFAVQAALTDKDRARAIEQLSALEQSASQRALEASIKATAEDKERTKAVEALKAAEEGRDKALKNLSATEVERAKAFRASLDKWNDGVQSLTVQFGRLVTSMAPIVSVLGDITKGIAEIMKAIPEELLATLVAAGAGAYLGGKVKRSGGGAAAAIGSTIPVVSTGIAVGALAGNAIADQIPNQNLFLGTLVEETRKRAEKQLAAISASDDVITNIKDLSFELKLAQADAMLAAKTAKASARKAAGDYDAVARLGQADVEGVNASDYLDPSFLAYQEQLKAREAEAQRLKPGALGGGVQADGEEAFLGRQQFALEQFNAMIESVTAARDRFLSEQQMSVFEAVFGTPETLETMFDAQQMLGRGFETLTAAVGNAYDAWVDGSMSAAQAFKATVREALKATGKEMAIEALKSSAWGFVYLARREFDAAANSFTAAGIFAGAALAAGGAAKAMGGGAGAGAGASSSTGSSASSGGAPRLGSGGGSNERQEVINIYIGDTLAEDNPRTRRNDIARLIRSSRREIEAARGVEAR